jgi:hypothetical protein
MSLLAPSKAEHVMEKEAEATAVTSMDATREIYTMHGEAQSFTFGGGADGKRLILWGCIAAVVSILLVSVVFLTMHYHYRTPANEGDNESFCGGRGSRSGNGRKLSVPSVAASRSVGKKSFTSEKSVVSGPVASTFQSSSSASGTSEAYSLHLPGFPLCPLLVVPDRTRLACIVQTDVCCRKQELSFDIRAPSAREGAPLFRIRVSELGQEGIGIYVETLSGREQLAFLSTEALWMGQQHPIMAISRPMERPYGNIEKGENGEYLVSASNGERLLTFVGDFHNHNIQAMSPTGTVVAATSQTSPEEYQAHIQARTDAGLLILGLLAIDKCENSGSDADLS